MAISGENASHDGKKLEAYGKILQRLREAHFKGATPPPPDFESTLWQHFEGLPDGYAYVVGTERVFHVLEHKRLLNMLVEDEEKEMVFEVRFLKPSQHEVIFASTKPMTLSNHQVEEIGGLKVQETHSFSSTKGHSLHILLVDGWLREEVALKEALALKIEPKLEDLEQKDQARKKKVQDTSTWKPTRASVFDPPLESLRKHAVAPISERIFLQLKYKAERDAAFGSKLVKIASSGHRTKAWIMNKLLLKQPCEFTFEKTFNQRTASLFLAKAAATLSVAGVFGTVAVAYDVVPVIAAEKRNVKKFIDDFNENLVQKIDDSYANFQAFVKKNVKLLEYKMESRMERLEAAVEKERKDNDEWKARVKMLEEDAAKRNLWFGGWFKGWFH